MKINTVTKDFKIKIIEKNKKTSRDNLSVAKYINIGYYLVTPILFGVFFGLFIDKKFNGNGIFVIGGIIFGTTATFYNLFKLVKN